LVEVFPQFGLFYEKFDPGEARYEPRGIRAFQGQINQGIVTDIPLSLSFLDTSKTEKRTIAISWDPAKTTITDAKVYLKATTDLVPSTFIAYLNGSEYYRNLFINPFSPSVELTYDLGLIPKGNNLFAFEATKFIGIYGMTMRVTSTLQVFYNGDPPTIGAAQTPPPSPTEWLAENWEWSALGVGGLIGAVIIYKAVVPARPAMPIIVMPTPYPTPPAAPSK